LSEELKELVSQCRALKVIVEIKNDELKGLKEELRTFMIDSGIKEFDGVEIRRAFSFDAGWFKITYPNIAEKFIKEETIKTVRDVVDKKGIKKHYPEEYQVCLAEGTARLYGL